MGSCQHLFSFPFFRLTRPPSSCCCPLIFPPKKLYIRSKGSLECKATLSSHLYVPVLPPSSFSFFFYQFSPFFSPEIGGNSSNGSHPLCLVRLSRLVLRGYTTQYRCAFSSAIRKRNKTIEIKPGGKNQISKKGEKTPKRRKRSADNRSQREHHHFFTRVYFFLFSKKNFELRNGNFFFNSFSQLDLSN